MNAAMAACAPDVRALAADTRLAGRSVLLVEDDEINSLVACEILRIAGLEVESAANGEQALERVRGGGAYEFVLMDMHMPVMGGIEATRRIRALPDIGQPVVIALTASVLERDVSRCHDAGMDDFLAKPIDPARLHATLLRWADARAPLAAA